MASRPPSAATRDRSDELVGGHRRPGRPSASTRLAVLDGARVEAEHRARLVECRVGAGHDEQGRSARRREARRRRRWTTASIRWTPTTGTRPRGPWRRPRATQRAGLVDAAAACRGRRGTARRPHGRRPPPGLRRRGGRPGGATCVQVSGAGAGHPRRRPQALGPGLDDEHGLAALRDGEDGGRGRRDVVGQRDGGLERLGRRGARPGTVVSRRHSTSVVSPPSVPAGRPQPVVGDADDAPCRRCSASAMGWRITGKGAASTAPSPGGTASSRPAEGRRGLAGDGRALGEHRDREPLGHVERRPCGGWSSSWRTTGWRR